MTDDERYWCTVHIANSAGEIKGCGFIVDARHVMTCAHVLEFCRQSAPPGAKEAFHVLGQKQEKRPFRLVPVDNQADLADPDVAILRLDDGETIYDGYTVARWETCASGMRYRGRGIVQIGEEGNVRLEPVQIEGTVGELDRPSRYGVHAELTDLRMDAGCSGGAVFNTDGERGLIGMVAEYRQDLSGTIIRSDTLRDCWPTLTHAVQLSSAFSDLSAPTVAATGLALDNLDDAIASCDREAQTDPFRDRLRLIERARRGALLTTIHGQALDLPERLSDRLTTLGPRAIVRRRQPGAQKPLPQPNIDMAKCVAPDEAGMRAKIEYRLQDTLQSERPEIASFVKAIRKFGRPLTIEVRLTEAFVAERGAMAARIWSEIAAELSKRDIGYPLFIFFIVLRTGQSAGADAMSTWTVDDDQFLVLEELGPVPVEDIQSWADTSYGSDVSAVIMRCVIAKAGLRQDIRLKELHDWLSGS